MAATNFTPIQLYFSTTASAVPTAANLAQGELAINITDGKLYYEDNSGAVQVIAAKSTGTIGGSTTQIQYNNAGALAGSSAMTFNSGTSTTTLTTLNLTNALGAIYGGTAQSTYAQGDIVYASATNTLSKLGIGTVNYILTSNGTVPQWVAPSSISVLTATNLAGGAAGSVPYQSGVATTTFLAIGTANRVMTSTGTAPQWVTALTGLTGVSSSSITNSGLTSGRVVYSTTGGLETDSAGLTFDGTNFATTGTATAAKLIPTGSSATGNGMYLPAANSVGISTNGTNAVYIDSSQNVGIGTTTPTALRSANLEVYNASGASVVVGTASTSISTLRLARKDATDGWDINYNFPVASMLSFNKLGTNAGPLFNIDSSGNVGIGTSSPAAYGGFTTLAINNSTGGLLDFYSGGSAAGQIFSSSTEMRFTKSGANYMSFFTNALERMRIDSAGIVTMSAYGAGAATFSAAGVISSVSDETWKIKDGVPVDTDAMLKKLEPGYWYYNDEKKETFGSDRQLGFYAQNVNAAIGPEAAPTPEEGKPWGYYDRSVLAVTVMSLQKALATIETLTARITALETA